MKQLFTNYSISGSTITLTGLNVPLNQLLCIEDNTNGKELYATGTVAPTSYTQGTNSVIVTSVAPSSNSDKLTIYYDDAVVSNINTSTLALESGGHLASVDSKLTSGIPVTGTFYQATQPVSAASLPLPIGASTSALQTTANTSLANLDVALSTRLKPSDTLAAVTNVGSVTTLPSITGSVTANAGTNLNTSLLALESGGNLATIATNTGKIPSKGSATTANSTPVNIASDQTVPISGTVTANTGLSQPLTDAQLRATAVPVSGTFYQATQPVSVASLPSLASGTNAIGTVNPDISPATGSLSSGSNTYTVTTTNYSTLTFQAVKSGTISSGTVTIYGSVDGTTFSVLTTYVSLTTGGSSTTFSATNTITAGQINTSGLKSVQFSGGSTIVGGGSLAFTVNQSAAVSNVMLDNALPVGSNTIGTVGLNAGTNAIGSITNTAFTANAGTNLNTSALALETGGNLATVATKMSDGTQTASIIIPSSFKTGQAKIAITGTAVQLGSNVLTQGVLISSLSTNAASITIGTSSGLTNTIDGTGNGAILPAGSTKSIAATNTNLIWINGTAGDIISFIGS